MLGINLNLSKNNSIHQNKFMQKPSVSFNGIKLNQLKSDVFQQMQVSFKGNRFTNEEIDAKVEDIITEYKNYKRTQITGYPVRYVNNEWFLTTTITELLESDNPDDKEIAKRTLNTLKVYPVRAEHVPPDNNNVIFQYQPDNTQEPLEAFMSFYSIRKGI